MSESEQAAPETDDDLMLMFAQGDQRAFDALFARHHASVYNFAVTMLHNAHEAEEILQDTFLAVIRAAAHYRAEGRFQAWLMRIVRNRCLDRIEAEKRSPVAADPEIVSAVEAQTRTPSPFENTSRNEREVLARRAIATLPERQREALTLFVFEDMRYEDIAQVLELPVGTVKTLLHRGRASLARRIGKQLEATR
jgi:RNA polymerase sigma-70 factor (ECF subfamily)